MIQVRTSVPLLVIALFTSSPVFGVVITPTLQDRLVSSSAAESIGGSQTAVDQDSQVAAGFTSFNAFVNSVVNTDNSASFPTAQQSSDIGTLSIVAEGDVDANSDNLGNAGVTSTSHSESRFLVAFMVNELLSWSLVGEVTNEDGGSPLVKVSDPGGTLFQTTSPNETFNQAFQLLPGVEYTIEATAVADALADDARSFSAQGATFRLRLSPSSTSVPDGGPGFVTLALLGLLTVVQRPLRRQWHTVSR